MKQKYDFKKLKKEGDEVWAAILRKGIANPISKVLIKYTDVRPNHVTALSFIFLVIGAVFLVFGVYTNLIIGAIFVFLYAVFDCVDGNIARVKGMCSKSGEWLEGITSFISVPLLAFSLALGINTRTGFILGSLAMLAFPMQYLIVRFYKLDIKEANEPLKSGSKKVDTIKRLYGSTAFYLALTFCALINRPIWVLWIFAIVGNIVWMITIFLEYLDMRRTIY